MTAPLTPDQLTEAYRLAQVNLTAEVMGPMTTAWGQLMIPGDLDGSFQAFGVAGMRIIGQTRTALSGVAGTYYQAHRAALEVPGTAQIVPAGPVDAVQGLQALQSAGPAVVKKGMAEGLGIQAAMQAGLAATLATAGKLVATGGRDTIIRTSARDPYAIGYARVTDGSPCHWCAMLAGRGPVYHSAQTAGEGEHWHKHCGCSVEPVYSRSQPWPGRGREYEQMWKDSGARTSQEFGAYFRAETKVAGSGADALAAYRERPGVPGVKPQPPKPPSPAVMSQKGLRAELKAAGHDLAGVPVSRASLERWVTNLRAGEANLNAGTGVIDHTGLSAVATAQRRRPMAEMLAEAQQLVADEARLEVIAQRAAGRVRRMANVLPGWPDKTIADTFTRAVAAAKTTDRVMDAARSAAEKAGLFQTSGDAGAVARMEAGMSPIAGGKIPKGAPVRIVRPGFDMAWVNGERVRLFGPTVEELTEAEYAAEVAKTVQVAQMTDAQVAQQLEALGLRVESTIPYDRAAMETQLRLVREAPGDANALKMAQARLDMNVHDIQAVYGKQLQDVWSAIANGGSDRALEHFASAIGKRFAAGSPEHLRIWQPVMDALNAHNGDLALQHMVGVAQRIGLQVYGEPGQVIPLVRGDMDLLVRDATPNGTRVTVMRPGFTTTLGDRGRLVVVKPQVDVLRAPQSP